MPATQSKTLSPDLYPVSELRPLPSPRLLVFRAIVERNVERMRAQLEAIVPGSGFRHLTPHVKTHKSAWATRLLLDRGVRSFKASLNELDMLLDCAVPEVFVAYPLLPDACARVARAARDHPATSITCQVASVEQATALAAAALDAGVELDTLIDVDVGNGRTGIAPDRVAHLARRLHKGSAFGPLRLRGIHGYDGHNQSPRAEERAACAREAMEKVVACAGALEDAGVPATRVVVGGSPGFLPDLEELYVRHRLDARVEVSPGTWIYWDTKYDGTLPDHFEIAAVVLGRVMDVPAADRITLDLGHKRWSIDQGPVERFSRGGLEFVSATEEHTVLRVLEGAPPAYGDSLLLAPRHVCPTVNLWESFTLIGPGGEVEAEALPVTARNR